MTKQYIHDPLDVYTMHVRYAVAGWSVQIRGINLIDVQSRGQLRLQIGRAAVHKNINFSYKAYILR